MELDQVIKKLIEIKNIYNGWMPVHDIHLRKISGIEISTFNGKRSVMLKLGDEK